MHGTLCLKRSKEDSLSLSLFLLSGSCVNNACNISYIYTHTQTEEEVPQDVPYSQLLAVGASLVCHLYTHRKGTPGHCHLGGPEVVSHNCLYYTSKPECAIPDDNRPVIWTDTGCGCSIHELVGVCIHTYSNT
jgi:hypothetical protein